MSKSEDEIVALQRARVDLQMEKATNRVMIQAKYKAIVRQEVEEANRDVEMRFARLLKEAHEAGVPQARLRSEVLRTNEWSRWTYWRDMAGIEPVRGKK